MQVYLSHSAEDRKAANTIAARLREDGFDVWAADTALLPGDNFGLAIGEALQHSDAMVVLVSPDSMASPWVQRELQFALATRRYEGRLIPVIVRPTGALPTGLMGIQAISYDRGTERWPKALSEALRNIPRPRREPRARAAR